MLAFLIASSFCISKDTIAQTVLYTENFNGASHSWTLNSTDVNSTVSPNPAASNYNYWIVNDVYQGGPGNAGTCLGLIALNYTFPNTPLQNVGISGAPTSKYLHTTSVGGTLSAGYLGVDGLCVAAFNYFSKMSSDISTIGYDEVTLKFWWIGTGADQSKMELYYSIDGGGSWIMVTTPIVDFAQNTNWIQHQVAIPAFANQATLRFGIRLRNQPYNEIYPGNVGYGIDDIEIIGSAGAVPNQITTANINPLSYCSGQSVNVNFTATGNYNVGNIFSAELSNASGSFASPTVIGTLNSTTSGTIVATIPQGTAAGAGYRIRVVSSNPGTTGSDNASNITVTQGRAATINVTPASPVTFCAGTTVTLTAETGFSNYIWSNAQTGTSIIVNTAGTYSVTAQSIDGCGTASSGQVTVSEINVPVASFNYAQQGESYTVAFENTSQDGASYLWNFGGGNTSTQANPSFEFQFDGTYPVTLTVTNACGTNTITSDVVVEKLVGLLEIDPELAAVQMFPNPAKDITILNGETTKPTNYSLSIINLLGQEVYRESFVVSGSWNKTLDISGYSKGIYSISLRNEKAALGKKLIIQ